MGETYSGSLPMSYNDETTPGGRKEVRWQVVAKTTGLIAANIIAGRLQSLNIPARAWQESAGQAYGLVVGALGTGYVLVPENYIEKALAILDDEEE